MLIISDLPFDANKKNALLMISIAGMARCFRHTVCVRCCSVRIINFENIRRLAHLIRESETKAL
jgi:hypothetical protein